MGSRRILRLCAEISLRPHESLDRLFSNAQVNTQHDQTLDALGMELAKGNGKNNQIQCQPSTGCAASH